MTTGDDVTSVTMNVVCPDCRMPIRMTVGGYLGSDGLYADVATASTGLRLHQRYGCAAS